MLSKDLKCGDLLYAIDKDDCMTILEINSVHDYFTDASSIIISVTNRVNSIYSFIIINKSINVNECVPLNGLYLFISCSEQIIVDKFNELCSK